MRTLFLPLRRAAAEAYAMLYRAAPGYEARLTATGALILSGVPALEANYALIFGYSQPEDQLRTFAQVAQDRELPMSVILIEELADRLAPTAQALGFVPGGRLPIMTCKPRQIRVPGSSLQIERITDDEGVSESNDLVARAFAYPRTAVDSLKSAITLDGPGVSAFLARREGIPVCTVWATRAGNSVGLWSLATEVTSQRQGVGHALLSQVMATYIEQGADAFYLGATSAGLSLYKRLGFRTVFMPAVWAAGVRSM